MNIPLHWNCALGLALIVLPSLANAETLTYTENFATERVYETTSATGGSFDKTYSANLTQFDPSLGTLDSLSFVLDFDFDVYVNGGGGGSISGVVYVNDIADPAFAGGGGGGGGGTPALYAFDQLYEVTVDSSNALFNEFIGTGTVKIESPLTGSVSAPFTVDLVDELAAPFMQVTYTYTPIPEINGDYNHDGMVDLADYTVWRNNLGASVTLPNDTTPGTVDVGDYVTWKYNFGTGSTASLGAATSVPEPAGVVLLITGALMLVSRRACQVTLNA